MARSAISVHLSISKSETIRLHIGQAEFTIFWSGNRFSRRPNPLGLSAMRGTARGRGRPAVTRD
jgi:hypothetical protein